MTFSFDSDNLAATLALGQAIGRATRGGEVLELRSDLGGGKTALTKGIAAGMGSTDTVQSPTFTISRIYQAANGRELHHFDFYRLEDPGIMAAELAESLNDERVVVVIEWSDIVADILPEERAQVTITATGEDDRKIVIALPESMKELVQALQEYQGVRS